VDNYKPQFIAGGATQNTARVAQWQAQILKTLAFST
jgi:hypothetical protein